MKTVPKNEEWTVEPVRFSSREPLVDLLLRRIIELEAELIASKNASERLIL
jgi:hypothetical protein